MHFPRRALTFVSQRWERWEVVGLLDDNLEEAVDKGRDGPIEWRVT